MALPKAKHTLAQTATAVEGILQNHVCVFAVKWLTTGLAGLFLFTVAIPSAVTCTYITIENDKPPVPLYPDSKQVTTTYFESHVHYKIFWRV